MLWAHDARTIVASANTGESFMEDWIDFHVNEKAWKNAARSTRAGSKVTLRIDVPPIQYLDAIIFLLRRMGYCVTHKTSYAHARDPEPGTLLVWLD